MSQGDDVRPIVDELAIRRVIARYCHTCDDGRFDEFAELFAEDAVFKVMGMEHAGRDAIKAFMAAAQPPERRGKHVTSNTLVDIEANGVTATAVTDYIFVAQRGEDGAHAITSVGRYHDELRRDADGDWRFAIREIVFMPGA